MANSLVRSWSRACRSTTSTPWRFDLLSSARVLSNSRICSTSSSWHQTCLEGEPKFRKEVFGWLCKRVRERSKFQKILWFCVSPTGILRPGARQIRYLWSGLSGLSLLLLVMVCFETNRCNGGCVDHADRTLLCMIRILWLKFKHWLYMNFQLTRTSPVFASGSMVAKGATLSVCTWRNMRRLKCDFACA